MCSNDKLIFLLRKGYIAVRLLIHMAWDLWIALVLLFLGIVYGYTRPGKEDRVAIMKKGIFAGVVLGVVFGLLIGILVPGISVVGATIGTTIAFLIIAVIFALFFIVGTIIGDFLERKRS